MANYKYQVENITNKVAAGPYDGDHNLEADISTLDDNLKHLYRCEESDLYFKIGDLFEETAEKLQESLRQKRLEEFALFDKYQNILLWYDLTAEQQAEFKAWRKAWLDAPENLEEPQRLTWFK